MVHLTRLLTFIAFLAIPAMAGAQTFPGLVGPNKILGRDEVTTGQVEQLTTANVAAMLESSLEAVLDLSDLQGSLTLAGDVDGAHGSNDLDEANVEAELEGVLDINELQGLATAANLGTDSVSADELNATGVEAELEAVLDLADLGDNYVADVADGTGIDGTASGVGATYTPTFDATELTGTTTFGAGAAVVAAADFSASDDVLIADDIDFGTGDVQIAYSANDLAFTGVTGDYSFDDTVLVTGTVDASDDLDAGDDVLIADDIDFGGGDVQIAYSANDLAFTGVTGDYSFDDTVGVTGSVTASVDVTATAGDVTSGDDVISGDDVLLSDNGVINFNAGDCSITEGGDLTLSGCGLAIDATTETNIEAAVEVTQLQGFGANVATWIGTPSVANLAAALSDEASGWANWQTTPSSANLATYMTDEAFSMADAELGAIAGLTSAANRIPYFTGSGTAALINFAPTDDNLDVVVGWDDSDGQYESLALAEIATEGTPAAGDFLLIYGAEGDLRKVDWDDLPGAGGGIDNVVEDTSPQLGGDLDLLGQTIFDSTMTVEAAFAADENAFTITGATDADDVGLTVFSTGDGANGTYYDFVHQSASPADGDLPLRIRTFAGTDGEEVGSIQLELDDGSSGSEDTHWRFFVDAAGASLEAFDILSTQVFTSTGTIGNIANTDGATGAALYLYHNSASPADGDIAGEIQVFAGADDEEVGSIALEVDDGSSGSEDTRWRFGVRSAGADVEAMVLTGTQLRTETGIMGNIAVADGATGAEIYAQQISASPADGDIPGRFNVYGGADDELIGSLALEIDDGSTTTEDTHWTINSRVAGADQEVAYLSGIDNFFSASNSNQFYAASTTFGRTDAGASGPQFYCFHDSSSPADNDIICEMFGMGFDDNGTPQLTTYTNLRSVALDVSDTTEDGSMLLQTYVAGTLATRMSVSNGAIVGSGTTFPGAGGLALSASATGPALLRLYEDTDNGTNFKGFISAAANTADTTCTFENDANFIPDSCVGDGSDASDERLKSNLVQMTDVGSIIDQIRIYSYTWNADSLVSSQIVNGQPGVGPKAQELFNILPGVVKQGGADPVTQPWTWKPERLVPYLVVEAQNARGRLADLEAAGPGGGPTIVNKVNDQTKTANVTLANDSELTFPVAANTKYRFRVVAFFDTTANADLKFALACPASPTLVRVQRHTIIPAATALSNIGVLTACGASTALTGTGTTGGQIELEGIIHNGANAGIVALQWAQNTSDAGASIMRAGSYLEYQAVQ